MKEGKGYVTKPRAPWLKQVDFTYIGIPNEFLETMGLKSGDVARIKFDGDKIIIEKIKN